MDKKFSFIVFTLLFSLSMYGQNNHLEEQISIKTRDISVSGSLFTILPPIVYQLDYLEELNISSTEIKDIPNGIEYLRNSLRTLNIEYNKSLMSITSNIGLLSELDQLSIIYNEKLLSVPTSIGDLKKLTRLVISRTGITILPDTIGSCTNLLELNLANNQLKDLPISLGNCKQIKSLVLSNNPFTEIPPCLAYFTNLQRFEIKNTLLNQSQKELLKSLISCAITD